MSSLIKVPYEISVWEDVLTAGDSNGNEYSGIVPEGTAIDFQYYKEKKLCVIGSNTMTAPFRATDPVLTLKTDGTATLGFTMYGRYYDEEKDEFLENPFCKYLTNERKIKLKYYPNGELRWLDFIIKKIDESSENYKFTYNAVDLFIGELSKSGYNLVFDAELENNQGTINKLATQILDQSEWLVGLDNEIIRQTKEEALYKMQVTSDFLAYDIFTNEPTLIRSGAEILTFYSDIHNCTEGENRDFFQFIYSEDDDYKSNEDRVIQEAPHFYCPWDSVKTFERSHYDGYKAEKYIRSQKYGYDKVLDKYVNIYEDKNSETVYEYENTKYLTPSQVVSFITNGQRISSPVGWDQYQDGTVPVGLKPNYKENNKVGIDRVFGIKYIQSDKNRYLMNSGFRDNAESIGEITTNQRFVFRVLDDSTNHGGYIIEVKKGSEDPLLVAEASSKDAQGYYCATNIKPSREVSYEELTDVLSKERFTIYIKAKKDGEYHIQRVELFQQYEGKTEDEETVGIILPDGRVLGENTVSDKIAVSRVYTTKYFYSPETNKEASTPEEYIYLYIGNGEELDDPGELQNTYKPVYDDSFEKIRSISKKETNRFDLLQTLSETFQCWCRFDIWHKENGEIMMAKDYEMLMEEGGFQSDEKTIFTGGGAYTAEEVTLDGAQNDITNLGLGPYQLLKFVTFHSTIGQKKNIGFRYGINLKSISRSLDSSDIATKLIVKSNTNQFADGGSCNIALAKENPSGESFIYDFSHYINMGLLNEDNLNNDLYYVDGASNPRGWIGLYAKLKDENRLRDELIVKQVAYTRDLPKVKGTLEDAKLFINSSTETLDDLKDEFYDITTLKYDEIKGKSFKGWEDSEKIEGILYNIDRLTQEIKEAELALENAQDEWNELETSLNEITEELKQIEQKTVDLIGQFERKYSRFIQEASWTSEDYMDNNLYYIDAQTTLHKAATPKISYNINIIELNQIEGYEGYNFDLGDITYIQDPDFFGWEIKDGLKTPRKQEIVITETATYLDSPEKTSIKAQTYRSSFEDLFKKLTASSQQLQFHSGEFQRAADVVDSKGNIAPSCLADALTHNAITLENATNQSVKWDELGITTTSNTNPAEIVRITSGGIFLTQNGGQQWTTGITAEGINAKTITTGALNTGKIEIYNGSQKSFTWDSQGINAYKSYGGGYDANTFVRFNQHGLFGVADATEEMLNSPEKIKEQAKFYLGWDGLYINDGAIVGGYLDIAKKSGDQIKARVIIDPQNNDPDSAIFRIEANNKRVMFIDGNGNAWFNGELEAATGTFNGELNAATGTFNGDLSAANGKFYVGSEGVNFNNNFTVDTDGNVKIKGDITGSNGTFNGELNVDNVFKISSAGVNFKEVFSVDNKGNVIFGNKNDTKNQLKYANGTLTIPKIEVGTISADNITSGSTNAAITFGGQITCTNLTASNGGTLAGWNISTRGLNYDSKYYLYRSWDDDVKVTVGNGKDKNNWRLLLGRDGTSANFGVDSTGALYAINADISGKITATEGGNIGGWTISSDSKIYSDKQVTVQALGSTVWKQQVTLLPQGVKVKATYVRGNPIPSDTTFEKEATWLDIVLGVVKT